MEHISKDISENISHILSVKMEFLITAILCAACIAISVSATFRHASVKSRMTELIIQFSLFRIT